MNLNSNSNDTAQPHLAAAPLELRVWGASGEQLATGLNRARQVLEERGITAGRAFVCHSAVLAYELDPSLPSPAEDVCMGAAVCKEAFDAAILAAGGSADKGDALAFEQNAEDARLWDTIPTLREWRVKNAASTAAE